MKKKRKFSVSVLILVLVLILFTVPFYIMLTGSLKNNSALELKPPDFNIFKNVSLRSYVEAFSTRPIWRWISNSVIAAVSVGVINVFVAAMAGYIFARRRTPVLKALFAVVIATMILPQTMLLIPNYLVATKLNLRDSMIGLVLTSVNPAYGVFLCRQYMISLPNELFEAAELDGCSELAKFFRIAVPLSWPAFGSLFIFTFLGIWNDFLWQSIMMTSKDNMTLAMGIQSLLTSGSDIRKYSLQFAVSTFSMLPVFLLFFSCQKAFIKGITAGSIKG